MSDDALKNSFDDSQITLEVRVIKNDMFDVTKHQKSKLTIEFTTKQLNFTSFSQVSVYSSLSAHSDWVHFQLHSHDDSDTESDEGSFDSTQYLWGKAQRRSHACFTSEHEPVVVITLSYIKAWIISGHTGPESTPWPDTNKQWLSDKMGEAWRKMTRLLKDCSEHKPSGVNEKPTESEACKVNMHS